MVGVDMIMMSVGADTSRTTARLSANASALNSAALRTSPGMAPTPSP